jgi:hypothetical protein
VVGIPDALLGAAIRAYVVVEPESALNDNSCAWPVRRGSRTYGAEGIRTSRGTAEDRDRESQQETVAGAAMNSLFDLLQRFGNELEFLPDKPEESRKHAARVVVHGGGLATLGGARGTGSLPELDAGRRASALAEGLDGVPLAHLTERQRFVEMEMLAGPGALVPRRETELLARRDIAREIARSRGVGVVDVCLARAMSRWRWPIIFQAHRCSRTWRAGRRSRVAMPNIWACSRERLSARVICSRHSTMSTFTAPSTC